MQKLVQSIHRFQPEIFSSQEQLFERLSSGHQPDALFITCADSHLNPHVLTQTLPGDLFILRNLGNLLPPYDTIQGGEASTIEFAVEVLHVRDVIVCGHSHCVALDALLEPDQIAELPATSRWLTLAEPVRSLIERHYADLSPEAKQNVAVQENVLLQLETLRNHPGVRRRLQAGELTLHGWVYRRETGVAYAYDPDSGQFLPIEQAGGAPVV